MLLVLITFPILLELLVIATPLWRFRRPITIIMYIVLLASSIAIFIAKPGLVSILYALLNCYRTISLGRILENRMHLSYLHHVLLRTTLWCTSFVIVFLLGSVISWLQAATSVIAGVTLISLIMSLITFFAAERQARKTSAHSVKEIVLRQLPTLTVAIPARNETDDLTNCLTSLLASDYPKLEILVLDDNSRGRAAEIIRSFAHDGVRFLPGDKLRPNWLAKNQAYQTLATEANGDLILFCGVDIRFQAQSLRRIVEQLLIRDKQMVCIMPDNKNLGMVQSMRYAWELALPRRLFKRPAVFSSCWVITKQALRQSGGFAAVTRMVVPESHFARELIGKDAYSLIRSGQLLGIASAKTIAEQRQTAIRTLYPQLHKRIELVYLTTVLATFAFVLPLPTLLYSTLVLHSWLISIGLIWTLALQLTAYYIIKRSASRTTTLVATLRLPIDMAYNLYLLNYSMWKYEFSEVVWKGRDISPSVMHVTPHLPKLT